MVGINSQLIEQLSKITDEEQAILLGNSAVQQALYSQSGRFVIDRDKVLAKGKLIDLRAHTRFIDFPPHSHNYVEMIYMCGGCTTHTIDDITIVLEKGDILLVNQFCVHAISAASKDDIGANIMILPSFFHTAFSMMEGQNALSDFILNSLTQNDTGPQFLLFKVSDNPPIQNLMENLIYSLLNNKKNHQNDDGDRINSITVGLLFQLLLGGEEGEISHIKNKFALRALKYVDSNYVTANLEELADSENKSIYQMSRIIKKETQVSFKQLVQLKRFSVALKLLRTSSLSVSDIIAAVGYENTSYFYRQFRLKYGLSPAEYRKKYIGKSTFDIACK